MTRQVIFSVGAGILSAMLVLGLLAGSLGTMILAYLAPLPLFYAGLAFGVSGAVLSGLAGTALSAAIGPYAAIGYFAVFAAPVMILVRQALLWRETPDGGREYYPPGLLITWLAGLAAAGLAIAVAAAAAAGGDLLDFLRPPLQQALRSIAAPDGDQFVIAAAQRFSAILPAIIATSWMLMMVVNGALAQGLAVRFGANRIPSPAFNRIALPGWLVPALALAAVWGALAGPTGYMGLTLEFVVAVPFFCQGLAVLHVAAYRTQSPQMVLLLAYGIMGVFVAAMIVVAAIGLAEQWANLRGRMGGPPAPREKA